MTCYWRALLSIVFTLALLQVPNAQAQDAVEIPVYKIFGGSRSGGFNQFIEAMDDELEDIRLDPVVSEGSGENLNLLETREAEFALATSDLAYLTFRGEGGMEKNEEFRAVLPLYNAYQQVFVRTDSGIEAFADLAGKRIAMGARGSTSFINGVDVLREAGIDYFIELGKENLEEGRKVELKYDSFNCKVRHVISFVWDDLQCASEFLRVSEDRKKVFIADKEYTLHGPVEGTSYAVFEDFEKGVQISDTGSGPGLEKLQSCPGRPEACDIDAVILTGNWREAEGLKHIAVPERYLRALEKKQGSYYAVSQSALALREGRKLIAIAEPEVSAPVNFPNYSVFQTFLTPNGEVESALDPELAHEPPFDAYMLSVMTYLMARQDAPEDRVTKITELILNNWTRLSDNGVSEFVDIDSAVLREPVRFHEAATTVLVERDMIFDPKMWERFLFVTLAGLVLLLAWASLTMSRATYDRLGRTGRDRSGYSLFEISGRLNRFWSRVKSILSDWYLLLGIFSFVRSLIAVLVITFVIVNVLFFFLRGFEGDYATNQNIENSFIRDDSQGLLWMFTWMATGFEQNQFPASNWGKIIFLLIGFAGVAGPLAIIFRMFAQFQHRNQRRERGESNHSDSLRDHTLICGWNNKVPGLVYSMTGEDSPEKLHVVIVAEMDDEFPLRKYKFDSRYVNYCKGDAADHRVLDRANAKNAKNAVIVADEKKTITNNRGSALTALALANRCSKRAKKKRKCDLTLVSEMTQQSNIDSLRYSDEEAIVVNGPDLAEKLIALACDNPSVIDFVLDMLTYDNAVDSSSLPLKSFRKKFCQETADLSAGELLRYAHAARLGILSINSADQSRNTRATADAKGDFNFLITPSEHGAKLEEHDEIIFSYDDLSVLQRKKNSRRPFSVPELIAAEKPKPLFVSNDRPKAVLLIGDADRAKRIQTLLGTEPTTQHIIEPKKLDAAEKDEVSLRRSLSEHLDTGHYDCVIFLNSASGLLAVDHDTSYRCDAEVIMRCQSAKQRIEPGDRTTGLKIIGEVIHQSNVDLLEDISVHAVVATNLIVQRFLAKPIFAQDQVTKMLLGLIDMRESTHLRSMYLDASHSSLVGKPFGNVLRTTFADGRIIGCIPKNQSEDLRNPDGDFRTHFRTVPKLGDNDFTLAAGDLIVCIYRQPF